MILIRTMLISFQPKWYEQIKCGEKIYEYRTQFSKEPCKAYMYVSKPVQAIIGYVEFSGRIPLSQWGAEYQNDLEISARIADYMKRRKYVSQILSFTEINPITLGEIKDTFPKFVIPQSYYYLDSCSKLFLFIKNKTKFGTVRIENDFDIVNKEKICSLRG